MTDRKSGMVQAYGYPSTSQMVSRAVAAAAANSHHSNRAKSGRGSKRYSVSAFYSIAAEQDSEIEDELAQGLLLLFLKHTANSFLLLLFLF